MIRLEETNMQKKNIKKNYRLRDFLQLINSVNPNKFIFFFGLFLSLITTGAALIVPQLTKDLIDTSQLAKLDTQLLLPLGAAFIAQLLFGALGGFLLRYVGEDAVARLREKLWGKMLKLSVSYYDKHKSGETSSRLVNDTTVIKDLVAQQFPNFVTGIIQLIGSLIILFIMDWKMASLMFSVVPVVALILIPIGRMMMKLGRQVQAATADFNADASEKLSEIRLIKSSNGEEAEQEQGKHFIKRLYKIGIKDAKIEALLQPIMMTTMLCLFVGILGYGAVRVQAGTLTGGTLVAFLLYLFNIVAPVATFTLFFSQVQKAIGATERISEILEMETEDFHSGEALDISGKTIEVKSLDFSYDQEHEILKDISFTAKPNTVVAFVGPSGSGKSTIFPF